MNNDITAKFGPVSGEVFHKEFAAYAAQHKLDMNSLVIERVFSHFIHGYLSGMRDANERNKGDGL